MRCLIIAPHCDDELIGCSSVLFDPSNEATVAYLYELTDERTAEALHLSSVLNFSPLFNNADFQLEQLYEIAKDFEQIYIPSRSDLHLNHKQTFRQFIDLATHTYQTNMAGCALYDHWERKLELLNQYYTSQKELWTNNASYYLFERIDPIKFPYWEYKRIQVGIDACVVYCPKSITFDREFSTVDELCRFILSQTDEHCRVQVSSKGVIEL